MNEVKITKAQAEKLRHALAAHKARDGVTFRNYFCAADGDADMEALVVAGFMRRGGTINGGHDRYYHATEVGMALCGIRSVTT